MRWCTARAKPSSPVYCPPYFDRRDWPQFQGRFAADPYHPSSAPKLRPGRKKIGAIAAGLVVAMIGGGWLAQATPPAHVSPWQAVRGDHPPKEGFRRARGEFAASQAANIIRRGANYRARFRRRFRATPNRILIPP